MKAQRGKLKFNRPYALWIEQALVEDSRIELLALTPRVCIAAVELGWDNPDPADRIIVATARVWEAPLVTADERIRDSEISRCIWD